MRYWSIPLLVLLIVLSLASCASNDDGDGWDDDGKADGWGTPSDAELEGIAGLYGLRLISEVVTADIRSDGSLSDDTESFTIELVGLVTLDNEGATLSLSIQPCGVTLPEIDDRRPVIDDNLFSSMEPIAADGTAGIDEDSVLHMTTRPAVMTLGVDLAEPFDDPMPQDEDDPAVVDQDQDGEPGVTVEVSGWEVYLGIRSVFEVEGAFGNDGRVAGSCTLDFETEIYGDNVPFFDAREEAEESAADNEIVSQNDTFVLIPIEDSLSSCEALRESNLFD
jgi:hypothetical protein